ncbi:hypothetical protein [Bradyrhizobium sp. UFLA05-112]
MSFSHFETDKPLPDSACWYRFLTNADHVTRDQTVHYQALKGGQFSSSAGKPWQHELSGAVVGNPDSADQIRARGEARIQTIRDGFVAKGKVAPSKIKLVGVAFAAASHLRVDVQGIRTDTAYTPDNGNPSHSDFVTFSSTNDQSIDPVRHWLMQTLAVLPQAKIEQIAP